MNANEGRHAPGEETGAEAEMGDDHFDGGDLCPACLAELTAGCGFCPQCGAPVTPTAAISPFERIFSEGYIYRQAVASPRKLIVVVGAWLLFLPLFLCGVVMLGWGLFFKHANPFEHVIAGLFFFIAGGLGLFHVTRNYLRRPRSSAEVTTEG
jgi:hypothetical protein